MTASTATLRSYAARLPRGWRPYAQLVQQHAQERVVLVVADPGGQEVDVVQVGQRHPWRSAGDRPVNRRPGCRGLGRVGRLLAVRQVHLAVGRGVAEEGAVPGAGRVSEPEGRAPEEQVEEVRRRRVVGEPEAVRCLDPAPRVVSACITAAWGAMCSVAR